MLTLRTLKNEKKSNYFIMLETRFIAREHGFWQQDSGRNAKA